MNGTSISNVYTTFASDVYNIIIKANKELDSQTVNIITSIKNEKDKIAAKMEACISPKLTNFIIQMFH